MNQDKQAAPQPISFEVELNKDLNANPPVKQRLLQCEKPQITME